jgi:hypothetical protein
MMMIASHLINAIKTSMPKPFTKPVIAAAIKHPNKEIAKKSKSLIEKLAMINANIMKIVIRRITSIILSENNLGG